MNKSEDQIYMQRAFQLAQKSKGNVTPNPMVGCVIVHQNQIIGEGWHQQYGGSHAEVHAINSVKDKSKLPHSTVYVTLEPCAHFGKTPPCADLLIRHQLKRVVIANRDPFKLVDGNGIQKLEKAGVEVTVGMSEDQGTELNKRFFTNHQQKRPYVILKWAQTRDGFVARENYDSKWISHEHSRKLVHKWRAEEDAIMVGTNTAHYDNPSLNVRNWEGKHPLRVVIDKNLRLDRQLNLFDRSIPTVCYNLSEDSENENLIFKKLNKKAFLKEILHDLHKRKIASLFVEGGSGLLQSFITEDLWDEARVFTGRNNFQSGISAPTIHSDLKVSEKNISGDLLSSYKNS